jgi:chromosome segregation ATPase
VAELAEALKTSQDEKKIAEAALQQSKKELEKVQKDHEDDLSLIENLREKHERAAKTAEGLRINNASLTKSLSAKDRKILDLSLTSELCQIVGDELFFYLAYFFTRATPTVWQINLASI